MPDDPDPIAAVAHITRNIARLAAERGFIVAEVETPAGMRRGFLFPVDGFKLRVTGIAAVADVLAGEPGDIVDRPPPSPSPS
jgi:hypothetical protein